MKQPTVTLSGVIYDQRTGRPLRHERGSVQYRTANQIHSTVQHSTTLNRKYLTKPTIAAPSRPATTSTATAGTVIPVTTTTATKQQPVHKITKFAPHPIGAPSPRPKTTAADIAPVAHPLVQKATAKHQVAKRAPQPAPIKPSSVLKQEAIADATKRTLMTSQKKEVKQPSRKQRINQSFSIASAALGLLLLGGYLTYLSMPNISTRVAAAQAGINANYPSYKPSGYSLAGPVAYQQGAVSMKFAANGTPVAYTLTQARSGWDSSAVLDNYITPKAGEQYTTTTANGLTIYTFDHEAAWVNGGILYTISGNAPLSNEQIQHIATSV